MEFLVGGIISLIVFGGGALVFLLIVFIRQVDQYERGILFSFGKYSGMKEPGWRFVIPVIQKLVKVDVRVKAVDVPDQEAITHDNISISINAVIYYKVRDAAKAIIEVENFYYAVSQLAQTTMRNVVGEVTLDQLLQERDRVADQIEKIVDEATDPWGIEVVSVELKDVRLPDSLKRTMAKEAEAEREKRAVIINSQGELEASQNLAKAAMTLNEAPGALHLRTLHAINDISSDQSNTTVWMIPNDGFKALEGLGKLLKDKM